jgi:undecaprenyl diphosphate synthase
MLTRAPRRKATQLAPAETPEGGAVPRHVAIIMDGNGRWAKERGLSRQAGHRAGTENLRRLLKFFVERRVRYLTL